jgi:hypothetical protein
MDLKSLRLTQGDSLGCTGSGCNRAGADNQRPLGFTPNCLRGVKTPLEKSGGTQRRWCARASFVVSTLRVLHLATPAPELLTSDAVFEPMQGKWPLMAMSLPSIIFGA